MSNGDVMSAVGCLLGLVGIVLAVYFYLKARRSRRLEFDTRTFGLLSDPAASLPGFQAKFRDHDLKTLTAAKILLWNSGTEIVHGSDVASADPISFRLPDDCEILTATITDTSDITNEVRTRSPDAQRNVLQITFDYLAPRQGCVILLLHSGKQDVCLLPGGTLKGAGRPQKHVPFRSVIWLNRAGNIGVGLLCIASLICAPYESWLLLPIGLLILGLVALLVFLPSTLIGRTGSDLDKIFRDEFEPEKFAKPQP